MPCACARWHGILIRHARAQLALGFQQSHLGEILIDVPHLGRKLLRPLPISLVVVQQRGIFLHRRPASGGVGHDGVELRAEHGIDVAPRLLARQIEKPRVQLQRSAARLLLGNMHFDSVLRQHANGGAIQFRKGNTRHASDQQRHSATLLAFRRKHAPQIGERKLALNPRRQRIQLLPSPKA